MIYSADNLPPGFDVTMGRPAQELQHIRRERTRTRPFWKRFSPLPLQKEEENFYRWHRDRPDAADVVVRYQLFEGQYFMLSPEEGRILNVRNIIDRYALHESHLYKPGAGTS